MLNHYIYLNEHTTKWVSFVHGAGGSSSIWFRQIRAFKKEFNVLILDLRGHGNSKPTIKDTFNNEYTFNAITQDIIEVLAHLKIHVLWSYLEYVFFSYYHFYFSLYI